MGFTRLVVLHCLQLPCSTLSFTSGPAEPIIVLLNDSRSLAYARFLAFFGKWCYNGNTKRMLEEVRKWQLLH